MSADDEPLVRARRWIFEHGGLRGIRVFTRYWLALLGEWPWSATPNLPPEVIANPRHWFAFDIYNFASWARATLLPLAVLSARRAVRPLPPERRLDELFPDGRERMDYRLPRRGPWLSWRRVFLFSDRFLHLYQQLGFTPFRETAINACLGWIVRHQDADGAWGGIQPPWIYSLMALNVEGYELKHPVIAKGLAALDTHWSYERGGTLHIQASESPVWDTLLALLAMQDCDREFTPAMTRALDWVLSNEVRYRGDWTKKVKGVEPSGWAFERANLHYPDIDDTAVALIVLSRLPRHALDEPRIRATIDRALGWTLAMQSSNGGWAAFDKDNDRPIITKIPFCDFGEALDPPSADVTAHVLEALGLLGFDRNHPAVERGLQLHSLRARNRRQLVRPLGRQPHLRHRSRAAGARRDRRGHDAAVRARGRRLARCAPERRRRLGRDVRVVHGRQPARPRAEHGVADGLGAARARRDGEPRLRAQRFAAASAFSSTRSATTARGTSRTTPARAFPATASARAWTSATRRRASESRKAPSCSAAS